MAGNGSLPANLKGGLDEGQHTMADWRLGGFPARLVFLFRYSGAFKPDDAVHVRNHGKDGAQMTRETAMSEWQPIETAPRDGTEFQARIPGYGDNNLIAWRGGLLDQEGQDCGGWCYMGTGNPPDCWTDGICWMLNDEMEQSVEPTHWMPLPEPPKDDTP